MKSLYSKRNQLLIRLLRESRMEAGITQTKLSEALGRPQSFVSKYENGDRRLDVVEFLDVCKLLGADPVSMIGLVNKE